MADCPVVTIRFYEKEGLLPEPERAASNYRLYGDEDIERLRFITHCRRHGIKLAEIRQLLALRGKPGAECVFAHELIDKHLAHVEEELASLNALMTKLRELKAAGCNGESSGCPILKRLGDDDHCHYCNRARQRLGGAETDRK